MYMYKLYKAQKNIVNLIIGLLIYKALASIWHIDIAIFWYLLNMTLMGYIGFTIFDIQ